MRTIFGISALAVLLIGGWWLLSGPTPAQTQSDSVPGDPIVAITLPASFTEREKLGMMAFNAKCADCHGTNAVGKEGIAPPLVHKIYEPNHHADLAFERAVQNGVRAHHWPFGNMPPVEGLTRGDVGGIVAYVRVLQRENGIN